MYKDSVEILDDLSCLRRLIEQFEKRGRVFVTESNLNSLKRAKEVLDAKLMEALEREHARKKEDD